MNNSEQQYLGAVLRTSLVQWRHDLHRMPELGFAERKTADYVAAVLQALGLPVQRGIGGTGIVASLRGSGADSGKTIALRADMDALAIAEAPSGRERAYISQHPGCMHACGHDGHTAMVLGAAHLLCERPDFAGTVRFIFQPAEEHGKGAKAMMADGLFTRFPVDEIYGAHNMPGMPAGHIAVRSGGIMASEDNFRIRIQGRGGHAARPHMAIDPLVIAAEIILALQTIVARTLDPGEAAVVSCTEIHSDGIRNAIPGQVEITGDTRSYSPTVQAMLQERMRALCCGIAAAHGASCEVEYTHEFAPTVNWPECAQAAARAARSVVGDAQVDENTPALMISEDFGAFLQHVPGAFVFLGNGAADEGDGAGSIPLHNAAYDFNDALLPVGARFFATLARQRLAELGAC